MTGERSFNLCSIHALYSYNTLAMTGLAVLTNALPMQSTALATLLINGLAVVTMYVRQ